MAVAKLMFSVLIKAFAAILALYVVMAAIVFTMFFNDFQKNTAPLLQDVAQFMQKNGAHSKTADEYVERSKRESMSELEFQQKLGPAMQEIAISRISL